MKLFNTLSRQIENFQPQEDNKATIYSCGPTVYNHIHIGNLSSFIAADTLRRTLKANGLDVQHVMNFTDIDDKTIARSAEQFPDDSPEAALKNLTSHYSEIFLNDLQSIGFDVATMKFINATDNIAEMQKLITELYEHKFAYITDDGVYFSIQAYQAAGKKYGQLSPITVDSTSQARIRNDEYDKESAHDFVLWKLKTANEPAWEFNLDGHQLTGRPGWHIECSAMSQKTLGQPFDIHTGGVDLIFPHHENEIAQSTATKNEKYANYFIHNEHLLVDGRKMSKSLNNFFTLRDIVEKAYDPIAFRLMVLQSHYRNQSNFTWENLSAAQNRLKSYQAMADLKHQTNESAKSLGNDYFINIEQQLKEVLSDDLKTPEALKLVSEMASQIESNGLCLSPSDIAAFETLLKFIDESLGINLSNRPDIDEELKNLLHQRETARQQNNWPVADQLRAKLEEQGIGLKDTPGAAIWFRL